MITEVLRNSSATAVFNNLQSGLATPYWEANITVSGDSSTTSGTLGAAYNANNKIISIGNIDRERPIAISGLARIVAGNVIFTLDNQCGTYSPLNTAGIFTDTSGTARDYIHSTINIWAGFVNTSGTAYTIQRGSFLLTQLRIDSEKRIAYLATEDAAKIPLNKFVGLPDISGTAVPWTPNSGSSTRAIMSELLSAVGLTANQWSLDSGINHSTYVVESEKVSNALGKLAQRSNGFIFTNGKGQIIFDEDITTGGLGSVAELELRDTNKILNMKYVIDVKNLVNEVNVNYTSGLDNSRASRDAGLTKGRQQIINNDSIDLNSIANSVSSRLQGLYGLNRTFITINNVWLPSLEVNDDISIWDTNTFQTSVVYNIYKIREDIMGLKTTIFAINDEQIGKKFGIVSDNSAANSGTIFTDSWSSGFAFVCRDIDTATRPAFDQEGNDNNIINTALTVSGAGGTGIELPFVIQ